MTWRRRQSAERSRSISRSSLHSSPTCGRTPSAQATVGQEASRSDRAAAAAGPFKAPMTGRRPHLSLGRRVAIRTLVSYLITFAILRVITAIIYYDVFPNGPFHFIMTKSGLHIHHLFWGILLIMATGFGALATRAPQ